MYNKDPVFSTQTLDQFGPLKIIFNNISPASTVLDVGCNSGHLAKLLSVKNCKVDGIDINLKALKIAQSFCNKVYSRNLYVEKINLKQKYDYIVFSDILEHLPRPDLVLTESIKNLNKNGQIWISLPNIARLELRLSHLLGNFEYKPGIMSTDHLRFFTQKTAKELITSSGLKINQIYFTGLGQRLKVFPNLFSFQFVFCCLQST